MDAQVAELRQQAAAYGQQLQAHYAQQYQQAQQPQIPAYQEHVDAAKSQGFVTYDQIGSLAKGFDERLAGLQAQNEEHLQAMHLVHEQTKRQAARYDPLIEQSTAQRLDVTIAEAASRLGIKEGAMDYFGNHARNVHAAYEGDDLNEAYPDLLDTSWKDMLSATAAMNKAEVQEAKRGLSSSGGTASPSKPLDMKLDTPEEIADEFWTDEEDEEI